MTPLRVRPRNPRTGKGAEEHLSLRTLEKVPLVPSSKFGLALFRSTEKGWFSSEGRSPKFHLVVCVVIVGTWKFPSDTKLLLTKNDSEIIIFGKLRISRVIPWKCLSFLDISRAQNPSKITKNNSQGIIFVIISCQRVPVQYWRAEISPKFSAGAGNTFVEFSGIF